MATDRHKSKLNKLPDHKVWKAGEEGVHNHIVMRLNLLHLTISQDIGHVLGHDPKGQLLATMCLNATVTFLTQMLAFVDSIYDKLVVASKFTAEQGWSLTMKILDRICEDLYAPKEGVVVAMNVEDPSSICAHVLWSCFRTHDIMATYMDVNFENHPAISAEYAVKFLATNSGFEKVERLETTVASFKSLVDKASSDAAKAKSVADGTASAASSATKALAELVKQVGKVENKDDAFSQTYSRLKLCKRGHREALVERVCGVSFEDLPVWLWKLRLAEWSSIHIVDTDEVHLGQYHVATWEAIKSKLVIGKSYVGLGVNVWLVSGSLQFLCAQERLVGEPMVGWLSDGGRRRPKVEGSQWSWFPVSHSRIGGVTKSTGMFGTIGFEPGIVVADDPIRRSIGHVIKHSERPKPCSLPITKPHYITTDLLSVHQLHVPVVFPSGFSRTGWGQRPLIGSELAHAFDLPAFIAWESIGASKVVPIHMFRVVLDAVLATFAPAFQDRDGSHEKRTKLRGGCVETSLPLVPLDTTWLPGVQQWLPGAWTDITISHKAVKSDNAAVDFFPWNQRIQLLFPCPHGTIVLALEELMMQRWRRSVVASFLRYLITKHGRNWNALLASGSLVSDQLSEPAVKRRKVVLAVTGRAVSENVVGGGYVKGKKRENDVSCFDFAELKRDVVKGRLVVKQVLQSNWWEWTFGSALLFWRWNGVEQIAAARDGMRMHVQSSLPIGRKRMKRVKLSLESKKLVGEKIEGMQKRFYLEATGHVSNSLSYFAVPKGEANIRVVFDGSACGLNKTLWAPNFFLPSANSAAMLLTFGTWMADMDFGEMFHNFPMEERMRRCSGIEFETRTEVGGSATKMLRWTRLFMGMRPSPYIAVRYYYWGEEFARDNPARADNPMGYDCIRLNLPGMSQFDPMLPKVMKWRTEAGVLAGDVITFVDDVCITGHSKETVTRCIVSSQAEFSI